MAQPRHLQWSYCFWHDPESSEEAAEARRVGGRRHRREKVVSSAFDFGGLDGPDDVRRLLEIATLDTLALENSIARNHTLVALAMASVWLLEVEASTRTPPIVVEAAEPEAE